MKLQWLGALAALTLGAAGPALADGGISFIIDGDTFDQAYSFTNTSTAGETVVSFGFDLTGIPFVFDTVDGGAPGNGSLGQAFAATGGTDLDTGLVSSPVIADAAQFFSIDFNNFGVAKTFSFLIDVDGAGAGVITVLGSDLIGAQAYADFSNGLRGFGTFTAVDGNPDASQFTILTNTPTPGVPEPASWAMLIMGFGGIGGLMRLHRRRPAFT
jgi:hypothetical protein